jgi:hypothetical protein
MMNDIEDEQRSIEETEQSLIDEEKAAFVERWR